MPHRSPRSATAGASIDTVVGQLCASPPIASRVAAGGFGLPSREVVVEVAQGLRSALFPGYFGVVEIQEGLQFHVGAILAERLRLLREQVQRGIAFVGGWQEGGGDEQLRAHSQRRAAEVVAELLALLPQLQRRLWLDVEAAYAGDPAATSRDEALFCYPGVQAIIYHRLAHELYRMQVPLIPRIISEHAHGATGIEIHPGATIGSSFFIDHGTGVVIGETCEIGDNVRIYQGATLGAKSFPLDAAGQPIKGIARHPIVADEVIIYSGATILGRTRIGKGAIIGANAWVTRDVAPGGIITRWHGEGDDLRLSAPT